MVDTGRMLFASRGSYTFQIETGPTLPLSPSYIVITVSSVENGVFTENVMFSSSVA